MPETEPRTRRVFVACCLRPTDAALLAGWSAQHLDLTGLRTIPAEHLHATMFFAAAAADEAVESMASTVRDICWFGAAFEGEKLSLFGRNAIGVSIRWTDSAGAALQKAMGRGTHRSVKDDPDSLSPRISCLRSLFAIFGEAFRPWSPHVTLARTRKRIDPRTIRLPRPPADRWYMDRICLFESRLSPEGPLYKVLATSRNC